MSDTIGLSVSIVSYRHDLPTLTATLDSLTKAIRHLSAVIPLRTAIVVVDNSEGGTDAERLGQWLAERRAAGADEAGEVNLLISQHNGGYGAGNNLGQTSNHQAMANMPEGQRWVLILNPDVVLDEDALLKGITTLSSKPACSMLSPRAISEDRHDLYLAHRYPNWRVLALRAIAPGIVRTGKPAWASALMQRYECRDLPQDQPHTETVCASGCFMLMSFDTWQQAGGFDERYFLYFEDYDLSCRLLAIGPVIYEPGVRIRHAGGQAAGKSGQHQQWFIMSAMRFFWLNGWPKRRPRAIDHSARPGRVRPS